MVDMTSTASPMRKPFVLRYPSVAIFLIILALLGFIILFFASGPRGSYQLYRFHQQKADLENEIKNLELKKALSEP